jgi:hypothetical protein
MGASVAVRSRPRSRSDHPVGPAVAQSRPSVPPEPDWPDGYDFSLRFSAIK